MNRNKNQNDPIQWSKQEIQSIVLLIIIFIAACIETDIYLPAFADMMEYFKVSEAQIQGILTWNFVGLCLSGPIYGPLSDAVGRRRPLFVALGLFLLGSIITVFSSNFEWLIVGRIFQGLGSGGCFTLGSAIIFDSFEHKKALLALNQLNTIVPLIMAGAPLAGGALNSHFGFRANFWAITLVVFVSWMLTLIYFKETLPVENQKPLHLKKLGSDFKRVLTSFPFWQMNLVVCLLFGGYLAFLSVTSILFIVEFKVPKADYPYYQLAVLGGWTVASFMAQWVISRVGPEWSKKIGTALLVMSVIGFQTAYLMTPKSAFWLTVPMVVYAFGYNWVQTPYFGEIMGLMPDIKGITGSLVTSFRLLLSAIVVGLVGEYYDRSIHSFLIAFWVIAVISGAMIVLRERKGQKHDYDASGEGVGLH